MSDPTFNPDLCPHPVRRVRDRPDHPSNATLRQAAKAPWGEIEMQAGGHFDICVGDDFETNVVEQLAFLAAHVPVAC